MTSIAVCWAMAVVVWVSACLGRPLRLWGQLDRPTEGHKA
jgi:hypothetical protein